MFALLSFASTFVKNIKMEGSPICLHLVVISLGGSATKEDGDLIAKLFGSVGKMWRADEKLFEAITGLRYMASVNA